MTGTGSRRVRAPRGTSVPWASCFARGCSSFFSLAPSPLVFDMSNNGLPPFVHMHVSNSDLLLSFAPMAVQGLKKQRVSS